MGAGRGSIVWPLTGNITVDIYFFNQNCHANIVCMLCNEFLSLHFCNICNMNTKIALKIQLITSEATNGD